MVWKFRKVYKCELQAFFPGNSYKNDLILKCSPTKPDYDEEEDVMRFGASPRSMLREALFPPPQRRMCLFTKPVRFRQGENANCLSARQHAQLNACKATSQRGPQAGRGGRGPQRPSIPIECGKSSILRMNEEVWEPRGGNDSFGEKWHAHWGFRSGEAFPERKLCTLRPESGRGVGGSVRRMGVGGGTMPPGNTFELYRCGSVRSSKEPWGVSGRLSRGQCWQVEKRGVQWGQRVRDAWGGRADKVWGVLLSPCLGGPFRLSASRVILPNGREDSPQWPIFWKTLSGRDEILR